MGVRGVLRRNLGEWFPHFWDVYKVGVFSGFPSSVFPDFFLSSVILFSVTVLSFWYGGTMSLYWWGFWPFTWFYCGADILFYRFFVFLLCFYGRFIMLFVWFVCVLMLWLVGVVTVPLFVGCIYGVSFLLFCLFVFTVKLTLSFLCKCLLFTLCYL